MTTITRSSYMPYPELVEPRRRGAPWKIEDSNAHDWLPSNGVTDKHSRRLFTPLAEEGQPISLHELAHVHWSPERLPRVRYPLILLQAVEDARINMGLEWIGLPMRLGRTDRAHIAHLAATDARSGDLASVVVRAVASLGTDVAPLMHEEIEALSPRASALVGGWVTRVEERLARARDRSGDAVAPFRVARQIARDLARDLERHGLLKKDLVVSGVGCCQIVTDEDGDLVPEGFGLRRLRHYARHLRRARADGLGAEPGHPVGRMKIARPPLSIRQPTVLRAGLARRRCATEGTQISRPDRLALDRAIFGARGQGGGGTVLVDTSGSMSLGADDVEAIVRSAGGAAVVAIYSGRRDEGELRIVARGDRRVASESLQPFASGNVVDLPALEWLAKQPRPRCWISDGCVTGVDDQGCETLLEKCLEVSERADITRYETAKEAIDALGSTPRR